ncbi:Hypothetical protein POVR2_LOCUS112 [uncultured virus]|nr:Hypothetical protein POVR2_LOCUS112 [uncultured virus]
MLEEYIRELIRLAIEIGHKEHWTYAASSCDVLDIVTRALCCELSCYKKDLAVFYQARNRSYMLLPDDVRYSQTEELYPSLFSNFGLLDRCLVHRLCFNYSEMMPDKLAMKLGLHSLIGDIAEDRLKARRETQSGMLEVYATVSNVDQRELDKPLLVLL